MTSADPALSAHQAEAPAPAFVPGSPVPPGLPGLDVAWSRQVRAPDADGVVRTWHLLDGEDVVRELTGREPVGVVLAVHGNPTWSYLWRSVIPAAAAAGWRVVAVDQLDMGFSERTGPRRLAQRIDDLGNLTDVLGIGVPGMGVPASGGAAAMSSAPASGSSLPVVALGHDWGGVVASGWAAAHREALAGIILLNTAVHQPGGTGVPPALRPAMAPAVLQTFCVTTPGFLRATVATARRPLPADVRAAYAAPYRGRARRGGIGAFVADIPATADHPSRPALDAVAAGLAELGGSGGRPPVPSLLVWGPADPVFRPCYLRDLRDRLPAGDVQLVHGAGHLVIEDADVAGVISRWLPRVGTGTPRAHRAGTGRPRAHMVGVGSRPEGTQGTQGTQGTTPWVPLTAALDDRATGEDADSPAVVQLRPDADPLVLSWRSLARRVEELAAGLADLGVAPGQRVALLVPPGPDLSSLFCACLTLGAVVVVADAGLGVAGLSRAVRSAAPDVVIAVERGLLAAAALHWPGVRIAVGPQRSGRLGRRVLTVATDLDDIARRGRRALAAPGPSPSPSPPPSPAADDVAAVLFTSGSTGPAKGVVYSQAQLSALRDTLVATYRLGHDSPLVAAFAPFALLGPLLGATTAVPATDVTAPHTLTARALADAVTAVGARAVFASPAALTNVVATAAALTDTDRDALAGVALLLSAGAPVGTPLLAAAASLMPNATARTPYGMTEALPVTDVSLDDLMDAGEGGGVLVGAPVPGARVAIAGLDPAGSPTLRLSATPGVTGEIAVAGAHVKERYDQLWDVQRASAVDAGWHRTGDVGHLDAAGRLWVEGRLAHVLVTASGALTPVGVEQRVQTLPSVRRAALVGVGPIGAQVPVVVVEAAGREAAGGTPAPGLAPLWLVDAVRQVAATPEPVAAVLVARNLPTDVRHRSKVDRTAVAAWAHQVLAGRASAARTPWRA